jgi:hypothetical protein
MIFNSWAICNAAGSGYLPGRQVDIVQENVEAKWWNAQIKNMALAMSELGSHAREGGGSRCLYIGKYFSPSSAYAIWRKNMKSGRKMGKM